jgi:hypothetical protein
MSQILEGVQLASHLAEAMPAGGNRECRND